MDQQGGTARHIDETNESKRSTLGFLLATELEAVVCSVSTTKKNNRGYTLLATLEGELHLVLANSALQSKYNLLRGLRLCRNEVKRLTEGGK